MSGAGPVTRALLAGASEDLDERDVAGRLCRSCVDDLDVDGAGLSLLTGRESRITLAVTDFVAQRLEDLQATLNEGVCVEAARSGRPVLVPDLRERTASERWPLFAAAVVEHTGVTAVFALPLQWGAVNLGVLDLYRVTPGRLTDRQWRDAVAAVETATLLMLGRRTTPADPAGTTSDGAGPEDGVAAGWLEQASGYRVEIYQATGMVQVQLGVSGVDALARLRSYSFAQHRLLIDVARDVVGRRLVFTEEMP